MNAQETIAKVQEMREFFTPVIEKAVKENVKILQTYFNNGEGCGCLLSQVYGIDRRAEEVLDKASIQFFGEPDRINRSVNSEGTQTFGGKAIWGFLSGWDNSYNDPERPIEFYDLGKELYAHYVSIGGK